MSDIGEWSSRNAPENRDPAAASQLRRHSVVIAGHRTSVSLENAFWWQLKDLAAARGRSLNQLITEIDRNRSGNLSSAIRVFVLEQRAARH